MNKAAHGSWLVNADEVIAKAKEHAHIKHIHQSGASATKISSYSRDDDGAEVSKYTIPEHGIPSRSAYQLLHDETALDGNPLLNLAS